MKKKILTLFLALLFAFTMFGVANAKFTCKVEQVKGNKLVLKNCQEKGLKRLSAGDTVSITKKRKTSGKKKSTSKKKK
jgi:hypothetical protein